MDQNVEKLRAIACEAMVALAEGRFDEADLLFHADAEWWIIGQGTLSHARVRALAEQTEGELVKRELKITGTIAEGNKVAVEARGAMAFADGTAYENTYHHAITFMGEQIIAVREYFDTHYVRQVFGGDTYEITP